MMIPNNSKVPGRAKFWKLGETQGGKEQIAVEMELDAKDEAGTPVKETRMWFGFFTDAAIEGTLKALRALGWQGTDVLELDTPHAGLDANPVQCTIQHETYEGTTRDRIRFIDPMGGGGVNVITPLAAEKRASFAARMKGAIAAAEQGKPKVAPARPAAAKPPASPPRAQANDDIPF